MSTATRSDLPTVLVVDDEPEALELYSRILNASCNLLPASSAEEALAIAEQARDLSVIVTDQRMPGMTGVEMLERLPRFPDVPKIVVTAYSEVEPLLVALNSYGLYGYLVKPVQAEQLRSMVRRAAEEHTAAAGLRGAIARLEAENRELRDGNEKLLRSSERLTVAYGEMAASLQAMQRAYQRMAEMAQLDELTGVKNRRAFIDELGREFNGFKRYHRVATLLVANVDRFEELNDRHGRTLGDQVLASIAGVLTAQVRQSDGVFRIGGDEFAVLLPEAGPEPAAVVIDKLRAALGAWRHPDLPRGVGVSIGMQPLADEVASADDWYALADAALHRAKRERRHAPR